VLGDLPSPPPSPPQEVINYSEHVWRHSVGSQHTAARARGTRTPRVSPARARELLMALRQCLAQGRPRRPHCC